MSAAVTFYSFPRAELPELVAAARQRAMATFGRLMETHAVDLGGDYGWSGYSFVFTLEYLHSQGVLTGSPYADAEAALTAVVGVGANVLDADAIADFDLLDPDRHDVAAIERHFRSLGMWFEEAGLAGRDAVQVLGERLRLLREGQVLIVVIS